MRNVVLLAIFGLGLSGLAVPASAEQAESHNNAMLKHRHTVNDGTSRRGANSFTQGQARQHIRNAGFTDVSTLRKDQNGVWKGMAVKGGRKTMVEVDFKGNVSTGQ